MDNVERIRSAATQLFATLGYDGTSLQAIAEQVGVTKQTLLYHYPSKDALRQAVLEGVFAHWRQRLPQMLEAVTSGRGRFDALTKELSEFFESDPDRTRLLIRELLDNPEPMRRLMADNLRPWVLLVAQYIRQGQDIDLIHKDVDPEPYVLNVIALVMASALARSILTSVLDAQGKAGEDAASRLSTELLRLTRTGLFIR